MIDSGLSDNATGNIHLKRTMGSWLWSVNSPGRYPRKIDNVIVIIIRKVVDYTWLELYLACEHAAM